MLDTFVGLMTVLVLSANSEIGETGSEQGINSVTVGGGYFQQWNRFAATGAKITIAYERTVADGVFGIGPRGGLLAGDGKTPFVGAVGRFWLGRGEDRVQGALGIAADLWINTGSTISSPVFLYLGGLANLRFNIQEGWFVGVPLEIGLLPSFSPKVFAFHLGVEVGRSF